MVFSRGLITTSPMRFICSGCYIAGQRKLAHDHPQEKAENHLQEHPNVGRVHVPNAIAHR